MQTNFSIPAAVFAVGCAILPGTASAVTLISSASGNEGGSF